MKKVLLFFVFASVTSLSFAQTSKSNLMLGGSASYNSYSYEGGSSSTELNVNPSIGYFVIDNLALGAQLGYNLPSGSEATIMGGPFVRYYFVSLASNVKLFGQADAEFSKTAGASEISTNIGGSAGLASFISKSTALEVSFGYHKNTLAKLSQFGVNVGFQIHFGGK